MDFNSSQAIYMQIVDRVCEQILTGVWRAGERALSVRELAVSLEVNPNTVMRSYEYLQNKGIIVNKRGIGFFVREDAPDIIRNIRKDRFINEEAPAFIKNMKLLGIGMDEIVKIYNQTEI